MPEPILCPLRTGSYQPGCSTLAIPLDTGSEAADVSEVMRQANVGLATEGLEELICQATLSIGPYSCLKVLADECARARWHVA